MSVVYVPGRRHRCNPSVGNNTWWIAGTGPLFDEPNTVRECECGRTWVAMEPPPGLMPAVWRREGRLERWWRERRQRRSGSTEATAGAADAT